MSGTTIDYAALAQKHGGEPSVDYASLAFKHGALNAAPAGTPGGVLPPVPGAPTPASLANADPGNSLLTETPEVDTAARAGFSEGARDMWSGVKGIGQALTQNPVTTFKQQIGDPATALADRADQEEQSGHPVRAAVHHVESVVPFAGPMAEQLQDEYESGTPGAHTQAIMHGLTDTAGLVVGNELAKGASDVVPKMAKAAASKFSEGANKDIPIKGENYTPTQHKALSAVLARGTGMGKDFIAPDVASDIASPVRQAAADNPQLVKVVQEGKPKDALGASQAILQAAKGKIDYEHQAALQPVATTPVDMKPVIDSIPSDKSFHTDAEVNQVQALRDQAGQVKTLGDLNDFRQYLGRENSPAFRQTAAAAGRSGVADQALSAADKAARDHYYDQLEKATGLDFQDMKRTEASIIKAQEALGNASPGIVNKAAVAGEDKGALSTLGDVVEGGTRAAHGLPVVGYAAEKLRGTPLDQLHRQLKTVFSDLPPASTYRGPLTSQFGRAPTKLPAPPAGGNARVGPNYPYGPNNPGGTAVGNLNQNPFGGTIPATPSVITPNPGQPPQLPASTAAVQPQPNTPASLAERLQAQPAAPRSPSVIQDERQARAQPIPARGPIIVSPEGVAQRGPAGALPARTGPPLQLGPGEGNPEFVTPSASPPPAFNPETARTNPNAGRPLVRPIDRPVEPTSPTITVSPEGRAQIQRALPPPETHAFDAQRWQQEHPNGNIKGAITLAKKRGYKVINEIESEAANSSQKKTLDPAPITERNKTLSIQKIQSAIDTNHDYIDMPHFALRAIPDLQAPLREGDFLPASYRWNDGAITGEKLNGTSGVRISRDGESINDAIRKMSGIGGYQGKRIALIGSKFAEEGNDPGEIVMRSPKVIEIFDRLAESPVARSVTRTDITSARQRDNVKIAEYLLKRQPHWTEAQVRDVLVSHPDRTLNPSEIMHQIENLQKEATR